MPNRRDNMIEAVRRKMNDEGFPNAASFTKRDLVDAIAWIADISLAQRRELLEGLRVSVKSMPDVRMFDKPIVTKDAIYELLDGERGCE